MSSVKLQEREIGEILDFIVSLSGRMLVSGANLERVHLSIERISHAYGLRDVSIYLLSSHISVSGKKKEGVYASRQISVPVGGIHLERLKRLNRLSYAVCREIPPPHLLSERLERASAVREYPGWAMILAQVAAMACLCLIFGGTWGDTAAVCIVTFALYWLLALMAKPGLDRVVTNAVAMWAATSLAIFLVFLGLGNQCSVILITVSMMVISGIPLVNAVRNLLCANEMNGILQLLKLVVESAALAAGLYGSVWMFGGLVTW